VASDIVAAAVSVIIFRVIVWFVSCFWAQLERLFQGWMTVLSMVRLQFIRQNLSALKGRAIIL
jgi:hypothetical protein